MIIKAASGAVIGAILGFGYHLLMRSVGSS